MENGRNEARIWQNELRIRPWFVPGFGQRRCRTVVFRRLANVDRPGGPGLEPLRMPSFVLVGGLLIRVFHWPSFFYEMPNTLAK